MEFSRESSSPRQLFIVGIIFCVLGPGLLAGGGYLYSSTKEFLGRAASAKGEVVELVRKESTDSDGDESITYAPVFVFSDAGGTSHRIESSTSSNPPGFSVGEEVEVLYEPDDPKDAVINSFFSVWGATLILSGIGAVFALVGVVLVVVARTSARSEGA